MGAKKLKEARGNETKQKEARKVGEVKGERGGRNGWKERQEKAREGKSRQEQARESKRRQERQEKAREAYLCLLALQCLQLRIDVWIDEVGDVLT
jgi:hypothetical protein